MDLPAAAARRRVVQGAERRAGLRITGVERWPAVGGTSLVWFDDADAPTLLEYWRTSNVIASIQRCPDVHP
jgi:hypothetical protein